MGLFSSSQKSIPTRRLDEILRRIDMLDLEERSYVKGLFANYRHGGISKSEILKAVSELRANPSDKVEKIEAEAIKKELLKVLEKEL